MLKRFFEDYKILENKSVKINNFLGPDEARELIIEAHELYKKEKEHLLGYNTCSQK